MGNIVPLGDILHRITGGGTPSRSVPQYWNGDIPWASVKDFREGRIYLSETAEHISEVGLQNSASNLIPEGTVVVCTRMAVGKTVMTTRPIAINQDLKALLPVEGIEPKYVLFALDRLRPKLESVAIGSTVKGISLQQLRSLKIYVPEIAEQRAIVKILDTLDTEIQESYAVIGKLQNIKAGLMDDLLTGQTIIGDIVSEIENLE